MRRLHFCISAFAVVILAWGWVMAQDGATLSRPRRCLQTIEGSVEDQTEAVIPEAKLILKNRATGESRETVANGTGRFSFEGVLPGEYSLKAEAKNFEAVELAIAVGATPPRAIKIIMKSSVRVSEEVTITATIDRRSNPLSPENNADAARFDDKLFSDLPTQGRNILPLVADFLSPAAQGTEGPSVVVNGVEANQLSLPASAIKHVLINKNPYSAEYRRPGKARIEVITKYGSERHFHGSMSVFTRNSALDARNPFARVKPDLNSRLFDTSFSGPLPGKRATFFLSGTRHLNDESVTVNALTPAGPFVENVLTPQRYTNLFGRIDLHLSEVHTLNAQYDFSDGSERNRGVGGFRLPERAVSASERQHRLQFSERAFFSANFLNDLHFVLKRENERVGQPASGAAIVVAGAFTGGPSQTFRATQETMLEFRDIASYFRGRHELRFGAEFRQNFIRATDASNSGGTFEFSSLDEFARRAPFVFRVNQGKPDVSFSQHEAYGFFQEEVRLRPNLSLTLGLRYGWQSNLDDVNNVAPRLAFAFAPGDQKTVLRGGVGIFYERLRETVTQQALLFDGARIRELVISRPSFPDPFGTSGASRPLPSIVRIAPDIDAPYLM
ncbi:MAG TPA: TonB-dependent receptor, partial [Candidatus Binatia bacterium]|nr:TonB-dependent receptor [Candidatus Binatia bacterium]